MIKLTIGFPRAGKSTYAALIAQEAQKLGLPVWSNMPFRGCLELNPEEDFMVYDVQDGYVILDEAGIQFNNRDYKNFSERFTEFFKLHGHYGLNIDLFSQSVDIDKKIRDLAEIIYIVQPSRIRNFIKLRQVYRYIVTVDDGPKIIHREAHWIFHKRLYAPKSYNMFDSWIRKELKKKEWEKWEFEDLKSDDKFTDIYKFIKERLSIELSIALQNIKRILNNCKK